MSAMPSDVTRYADRAHAGAILAGAMEGRVSAEGLVLGLPRGGVVVAAEVARRLGLPLDVLIVRKLGLPWNPELAMGAIASGGARVLNPSVVEHLAVDNEVIEAVTQEETAELRRRERAYRGDRVPALLHDRELVLVDDGLATGSTMLAAIAAVRHAGARRVTVAVPVSPVETLEAVRRQADEVICPLTPATFYAVGQWYERFEQTEDAEVRRLLQEAWAGERGTRNTERGTAEPPAPSFRDPSSTFRVRG